MNPTDKVRLGKTDLEVTRMGLGGSPYAGLFRDTTEAEAEATLQAAHDRGVRLFDTAPFYGFGKSELRLGSFLRRFPRNTFVLASKVGRLLKPVPARPPESMSFVNPEPFEPYFDFSYDGVMRSFEESLKRLGLDRIDILHIHDADEHYEEAAGGAYPALDQLRREGVIHAVSAGMNQWQMLARFARNYDFDCFLLAGRYTLIDQSALAELLPLCLEKGIGIIIGGVYNSGILATGAIPGARYDYAEAPPEVMERVRRVEAVCARHQVPLPAAALQFPFGHSAVASVIPGCGSIEEVDLAFRMMRHPIPAAFWAELKERKLLPADAPIPAP